VLEKCLPLSTTCQLTVVQLDTSAARVASTTALPICAATLLPDRNGADGSSEDRRGSDEVPHVWDVGAVIVVLEWKFPGCENVWYDEVALYIQ
jgi:hypothetical protein